MALTQRLQLRQSQALVMTPQLMQAIKLLQLSNLDLATYVEGELERNPLLDRGAETEPAPASGAQTSGDQPANGEAINAHDGESLGPGSSDERRDSPLDDTSPDDNEPVRP